MGKRNETGTLVQCPHCGYAWYTHSQRAITSCPNCGWRVRLHRAHRAIRGETPPYNRDLY